MDVMHGSKLVKNYLPAVYNPAILQPMNRNNFERINRVLFGEDDTELHIF